MDNNLVQEFVCCCLELEKNNDFDSFLTSLYLSIDQNDLIQVGMIEAIGCSKNNTDAVNSWFFKVPVTYNKPLIWFANVDNGGVLKYVWSVGYIHHVTITVQTMMQKNMYLLCDHTFLSMNNYPPYIIYFQPVQTSSWQLDSSLSSVENTHELDIFQVAYEGEEARDDLNQLLVMNVDFLRNQGLKLKKRITDFCSDRLVTFCKELVFPHIELLTSLHVEVHNWGHFAGFFPFCEAKNIPSYESVEEYRACLVGGLLGLTLFPKEVASALCVVIVLIYGFEPYLLNDNEKTFEDVREITVAALFYQMLKSNNVLTLTDSKLDLNINFITDLFIREGRKIQFVEKESLGKQNQLEQFAISMFQKAYPNSNFPPELEKYYKTMCERYFS